MLLREIPTALVEGFLEKRLVLFAGAGISVGSGLPGARDLAFQLQSELFRNKHVDVRPSPGDPFQLDVVAQRFQVAFGRQRLNETLLRIFQKDGLRPNEAHKLAVKLFPRIITTNFDTLLEDALKQEGRNPIVVVRDLQLPNTSIPDRTVIYKLHGDIGTPDRIVITQRDYVRVPLDDGIRTELKSILLTGGVIFIGYGLADVDFLRQLDFCHTILGREMPKSYAVVLGADKDALFVEQCNQDNIDIISDSAADFLHDLEETAEGLIKAAPKLQFAAVSVPITEGDKEYRATVCEEFRWIEFTGIPVPGGYLRVPINDLFVSVSAIPREELESLPQSVAKRVEVRRRLSRSRRTQLFKEAGKGRGLFEILQQNSKPVILGDPGSGKTTLLRYIGYHLALPEPQPAKIGLDKPYLPVFIPLRQYAAYIKSSRRRSIADFLPELLRAHNLATYLGVVRSALNHGEAILLLDGLDEVASHEERLTVAAHVQEFSAAYPACRLILTSRKVGYPKAAIKNGLAHFVVEPFSDRDIQTFLDLWCKATATETEKQSLVNAIRNPRVRALAENPFLITILARVYKAYRNLPERRAKLYAKCVEALLTTWDLVRDLPPVFQDDREANRIMGPLALWIHRDRGGQFVTRGQLLAKLAEIGNLPRQQQPNALLTQIEERSGLLREMGLNQYAFTHLTFQEYYVARDIVSKGKCFKHLRRFLRNDRWQEVIILTAGLLDDLGQEPVTEFLDSFVAEAPLVQKPTPLNIAKLNILIACLKDKVEPELFIADSALNSLLSLTEWKERIRTRWRKVIRGLPNLAGVSTSPLGEKLTQKLREIISQSSEAGVVENSVVLGFNSFSDDIDRADFFIYAISNSEVAAAAVWGIPHYVARVVNSTKEMSVREELIRQIRTIPLERRRRAVQPLTEIYPADMLLTCMEVWFTPEEMSTLPRELRGRVRKSRATSPS